MFNFSGKFCYFGQKKEHLLSKYNDDDDDDDDYYYYLVSWNLPQG